MQRTPRHAGTPPMATPPPLPRRPRLVVPPAPPPVADPALDPLDIDFAPIIEAIVSARGSFLQRVTSTRFLAAVLTVLPVIAAWLHGNVAGSVAASVAGAITIIYTLGEAYVRAQASTAAAQAIASTVHARADQTVARLQAREGA